MRSALLSQPVLHTEVGAFFGIMCVPQYFVVWRTVGGQRELIMLYILRCGVNVQTKFSVCMTEQGCLMHNSGTALARAEFYRFFRS